MIFIDPVFFYVKLMVLISWCAIEEFIFQFDHNKPIREVTSQSR